MVDFMARTCAYFGREGEKIIEDYPGVHFSGYGVFSGLEKALLSSDKPR